MIENFDGQYTQMECRKMLDVMTYNHIYNFIEAGVPDNVKVAHELMEVYNYFNPTAPISETHFGSVPECSLLGNPSINNLLSPTFGIDPTFQ